jgi:hypothetical protein
MLSAIDAGCCAQIYLRSSSSPKLLASGVTTSLPLVQKGSKSAGTIYFYRRIRLSTDCVISSGGSLRKPSLEIVFLVAGALKKPQKK